MTYSQEMEESTGLKKVFMLEHLVFGFELWVLDWKILAHKKRLTKKTKEEYFKYSVGYATFQLPIDEMIGHSIDVSEEDGISEKSLDDAMSYIEDHFPEYVNKERLRETMKCFFNVSAIATNMVNSERSMKINKEILGDEYDPWEGYTEEMEEKYIYPVFEKVEEYLSEIRKMSAAQMKSKIRMKRTQVMSFEYIRILDEI